MADHSLIMQRESVRGIIADTKTQTRRTLSRRNTWYNGPQAAAAWIWEQLDFASPRVFVDPGPSPAGNPGPYLKVPRRDDDSVQRIYPRVQPGDRFWLKEAWSAQYEYPTDLGGSPYSWHHKTPKAWRLGANAFRTYYRADRSIYEVYDLGNPLGIDLVRHHSHGQAPQWVSSIFMPRWASRLTLLVTDVRLQRLQDISISDARAEGISEYGHEFRDEPWFPGDDVYRNRSSIENYATLWDAINGRRAPWVSNPWVLAYTFERL